MAGPPFAINTLSVWRFGFGGRGLGPATTTTAAAALLRGVSSLSLSSSWSSVFWARKMPRVDADLKLDFKDVLFRPKRSSLKSRSEVSAFYHSSHGHNMSDC